MTDPARQLRDRNAADRESLARLGGDMPDPAAPVLVRIASGGGATPLAVFPANPITGLDADECDACSVTLTADTAAVIYVVNLGTAVPPDGTDIVAVPILGRYVIEYNG